MSILLPIDDEANDDDEEDTKDSQGGPNRRADDDFRDEGDQRTKGFTRFHCVSGSVHGMDKGCGGWDKTNLGPEVFE